MTHHYGHRTAAIRTKLIMVVLFGLGALAYWAGSEAVLPAYIVGIVLAGGAAEDHHWIRRLRTLTTGFLTPFYFLRAGMLVSVSAVVGAPSWYLSCSPPRSAPRSSASIPSSGASGRAQRALVLHADDVDGPDLRHHLRAVWPEPRDRHAGAVLAISSPWSSAPP